MVDLMKLPYAAALAVIAVSASPPLGAAPLDSKQPFICATLEIFACDAGFDCERETAVSVDAPQFLRISMEDKNIVATRPSGEAVNAPIEFARQTDQRLYLQGVVNKLGWSINVSIASGKMTLVAADDVSGYVIFGACTAR
jgi:hypothetical protein